MWFSFILYVYYMCIVLLFEAAAANVYRWANMNMQF